MAGLRRRADGTYPTLEEEQQQLHTNATRRAAPQMGEWRTMNEGQYDDPMNPAPPQYEPPPPPPYVPPPATPEAPTGGGGGGGGNYDYSDPRNWTPESLQAFASSRGVQGDWEEIPYWMSQRQSLYDRGQQIGDGGYGFMRLGKADTITPANQRYLAGTQSTSNSGPAQSRYGPEAWNAIMGVLRQGWGADQGAVGRRFESAREGIDRGRRSQTSNLRAVLADRGLLGSGPEATGYAQIEDNLAGPFSTALRDAQIAESEIASDRYTSALGQAVRMSEGETTRELGLGQLALGQLSENRQWNQFLANFGLDREKFLADIERGDTDQYMQLLRIWLEYGQGLSNGEVDA